MDVTWGVTFISFLRVGTVMEATKQKFNKDGDTTTTKCFEHGQDQDAGETEAEQRDPFAKAPKVIRTPPRPRVDSCPELKLPLTRVEFPALDRDKRKRQEAGALSPSATETAAVRKADDEVFVVEGSPSPETTRKPKKKKEAGFFSSNIATTQIGETEDQSAMSNGLIQLMQKLENTASELSFLTKKNVNTKVEIKKVARDIDLMSKVLATKLHKFCKVVARKIRKSSGEDASSDIPSAQTVAVCTAEVACQTLPPPRKQRGREEEKKKVITEAETDDDIIKAAAAIWRDDWYVATAVRVGNPWNSPGGEDFAIFLPDGEAKMEAGAAKLLKDRFPDVERIEGTGSLKTTNTVQLGTEEPTSRSRFIYKVGLSGSTEAEILSAVRNLKRLVSQGSGSVVIPTPTGVDPNTFRKLVELVFRRDLVRAQIYVPQRTGGKTRPPPTEWPTIGQNRRDKRERETDVLLIKQKGKSYTDMVRGLRETVGVNQEAGIKQIRRTQDGRLLVAFKKGDPGMETVKSQIQGKWEGAEVSGSGRRSSTCTVHVKGLDDGVEDKEIREAISELAAGLEKDKIEIGARRPMHGGNWAVTVKVADQESLVKGSKKLRIGFNTCTVVERVEVSKCYRCWEFGHLARNCKGPDRSSLCSGCGQEGHLAASCGKEPYCLLCGVEGHRSGSGNCPKFREALMGKRKSAPGSVEPAPQDG